MKNVFLNSNHVFGKDKLDLFNKMGTEAKLTDFAILMGADKNEDKNGFYWIEHKIKKENVTDELYKDYIDSYIEDSNKFLNRTIAVRPMLSFYNNDELSNIKKNTYNIDVAEYGIYPQDLIDISLQDEIEDKYQKKLLRTNTKCFYNISKSIYRISI